MEYEQVADYYNGENSLNDRDETFRVAFVETGFNAQFVEESQEIAKRMGRAGLPCEFLYGGIK